MPRPGDIGGCPEARTPPPNGRDLVPDHPARRETAGEGLPNAVGTRVVGSVPAVAAEAGSGEQSVTEAPRPCNVGGRH